MGDRGDTDGSGAHDAPVTLVEALGLRPLGLAAVQTRMVFRGDAHTPKSRFDVSSLRIFQPWTSLQTWAGRRTRGRLIPILNFVNRTPTPVADGWSVRKTQVRDWRGRTLSYDSHNGTDFIVPPGTPVAAAAPGVVRVIRREFHRGGLKVYVDHGQSLVTTYNHLARARVTMGQQVRRGEVIGLSGSSGADSTFMFPWAAPHLHFNVWFKGVAVDPFASAGEVSLWRAPNDPRPAVDADADADAGVIAASCDAAGNARVAAVARAHAFADVDDDARRGIELLIETITYPTRFAVAEAGRLLFSATPHGGDEHAGRDAAPKLTLPFLAADFDGICFA